jgi:hypothetical protein
MRHRADEQLCRVRRQHRVRVERDDEPDIAQGSRIPNNARERVPGAAAQILIELGELAALAFPAHPHALAPIPAARPVKEIEGRRFATCVLVIQRGNALGRHVQNRGVVRHRLARGIEEVGEQRELQMRITVREELHLEVLHRLASRIGAPDERGHHDGRAPLGRNAAVPKIHLRDDARLRQQRDELIRGADADLTRRHDA